MSNSKDSSSDKPSSDDQQGHHDRPQNARDDTTMQEAENVTGTNIVEIEGDSSNSVTPSMAQETGGEVDFGESNTKLIGDEGGDADHDIVIEPQEGCSKKQGGQGEELGEISSGVQKHKRKAELVDPPTRDPICIVCCKQFGSWKAVFGHMRSHPGRHWRGVFPPPTGIWDPLRDIDQKPNICPDIGPQAQEEIATTLLNVAQGVLQRLNPRPAERGDDDSDKNEGVIAISEASSSSLGRVLWIDLNQPQEKSPTAPILDLNKPAKEKDDDSSSDDGK